MKIDVKTINTIGGFLLVPSPIVFIWNLTKLAQGAGDDNTLPLMLVGLIITIIGLIMGNFKEEWLMEDEE